MTDPASIKSDQIRIDKWLWYARQTKTRSLAQKLVSEGNVRINRNKITSASKTVTLGDVLTITLADTVKVLKVVRYGERRGPFSEARELYEDLSPPDTAPAFLSNAERGLPTPNARPQPRERLAARKLSGKE